MAVVALSSVHSGKGLCPPALLRQGGLELQLQPLLHLGAGALCLGKGLRLGALDARGGRLLSRCESLQPLGHLPLFVAHSGQLIVGAPATAGCHLWARQFAPIHPDMCRSLMILSLKQQHVCDARLLG